MSSLEVVDGCPYGYRPYPDSGTNALNPCFISVISAWQAVFFLLIGSCQLWKLYKNKKYHPDLRTFLHYQVKLTVDI
ncbi:CPS_collapsed_G0036880.mRNA.1.CDS.1 [Saccharomyces cerevisiae]|nr:CPS_collapsed_G0036880.mRNA.1.CDS.1 [Saccharomyces cerevisiae]